MKNLLLLIVGAFILVVLFADGGLQVSPTVEFKPALSVEYAPIGNQSNVQIDTNIENQVIYQQVLPTPTPEPTLTVSGEPVGLYRLKPTPVPLLTLDQLLANYARNGGELPLLWGIFSDDMKVDWLKDRVQTWR